jgi:hypothetical protein
MKLRRIAAYHMAGERPDNVLQPTALVNEAVLRLMNWKNVHGKTVAHFFGMAAQLMRKVLVDVATRPGRAKRGGRECTSRSVKRPTCRPAARDADLDASTSAEGSGKTEPAAKSRRRTAIFRRADPRRSGATSSVCRGTVRRDWDLARAWLYRELDRTGAAGL